MSFLRFGKSEKIVDISQPISDSVKRNVHMEVDEHGNIIGVPEEWKVLMKDVYTFNDLEPTEDNLVKVSCIVQTSLKRKKTLNEGKVMKMIEEGSGAATLREKPGPRVDKKIKAKELMKELGNLCHNKSPWIDYIKVSWRTFSA